MAIVNCRLSSYYLSKRLNENKNKTLERSVKDHIFLRRVPGITEKVTICSIEFFRFRYDTTIYSIDLYS